MYIILILLLSVFFTCTGAIPLTITQGLVNGAGITHNFLSSWANIGPYTKDKKTYFYFTYVAYNDPNDQNELLFQASNSSVTQSGNYSLKGEYMIIHFAEMAETTFTTLTSGNKSVDVDNVKYIVKININVGEETFSSSGTGGWIDIYTFNAPRSETSGTISVNISAFSGAFDVDLGASDYIMGSFDSQF